MLLQMQNRFVTPLVCALFEIALNFEKGHQKFASFQKFIIWN